ncbi:MAG: hypothetical protein E7048_01980 [Lentisphaerae bacterium]|nr:hypothetical protein [Lentisphaerota bacterium]
MSDTTSQTDSTVQTPSPKVKKIFWLSLALVVIIVITAVPFLLFQAIFKPWKEIPPVSLTSKDFSLQYKLMRKVYKNFSSKKIPEKAVLRLTSEEINSLFKLAGNTKPQKLPFPVRYLQPVCSDNGVFSLTYPIRPKQSWLADKAIFLNVLFRISKQEGKNLICTLDSVKVNNIKLPASVREKLQQKIDMEIQKEARNISGLLDSLAFVNGKLVVVYKPQALMRRAMGKF